MAKVIVSGAVEKNNHRTPSPIHFRLQETFKAYGGEQKRIWTIWLKETDLEIYNSLETGDQITVKGDLSLAHRAPNFILHSINNVSKIEIVSRNEQVAAF